MKIENLSTVLSKIKSDAEKQPVKNSPPVPEREKSVARSGGEGATKAAVVKENEQASRSRQAETEIRQQQLKQESQQAVEEKVASAIESIRGFIQENQRTLDFDVAKKSNRIIISVIDRNTNEVIRQIPPEEALELAERIKAGDDITKSGLLLEGKA
jgi:flagellar protein FlaG